MRLNDLPPEVQEAMRQLRLPMAEPPDTRPKWVITVGEYLWVFLALTVGGRRLPTLPRFLWLLFG
jgi:hypothetical protein